MVIILYRITERCVYNNYPPPLVFRTPARTYIIQYYNICEIANLTSAWRYFIDDGSTTKQLSINHEYNSKKKKKTELEFLLFLSNKYLLVFHYFLVNYKLN